MRKAAIVIDLDNTLVDTVIRKHSLLKIFLPTQQINEKKVREDYDLVTILGPINTEANKSFMSTLDSEDGIRNHQAPLFNEALETLKHFVDKKINIILVTGRPEKLLAVTVEELEKINVWRYISSVQMYSLSFGSVVEFKEKKISELSKQHDIIAVIGDRLDDYTAALNNKIPYIHFSNGLAHKNTVNELSGGGICSSWGEIKSTLETILAGREKLQKLRDNFTDSYAKWLADLDNKARVVATISGLLATLNGKLYLESKDMPSHRYLLIVPFVLSVLSLIYCIRSMTSRKTSGPHAGKFIGASLKQWVSILLGRPKRWLHQQGDPVDTYNQLKKASPEEQARAHYGFFVEQF